MPSQPKRHKLPPLDLDEMANDPSMKGMLSFLDVSPEEKSRLLTLRAGVDARRTGQPTPVVLTPVETTPVKTTPVELQSTPVEMQSTPVKTTPVVLTPVETTPVVSFFFRRQNVHRAVMVQDAHSSSEQLLYEILWKSGAPDPETDQCRLVQIPQSDLAAAVRMTTKNLRAALDRLVEKLSIEEVRIFDRGTRTARVWRIYSYKTILERRKRAGFEWIVRNRGIRFIDPQTTPVETTPVESITTPVETTQTTRVVSSQTTGVKTTPPSLENEYREEDEGTSTTAAASPLVANAVINELGFVDDDALQQLVRGCRQNAADATDEEIAELAAFQAKRIHRMHRVDNPVGLLITETAKCFVGEPFARYRRLKHQGNP